MDSGGAGGALPDLEILNTLDPLAAQRLKTYLAIQVFWHAFEQAQATPESKVTWGSDYDVLDGQDDADLSFTALSDIRLKSTLEHEGHRQSLLPSNGWPQALAEGMSCLGLELAHWQWREGFALDPEQDVQITLEHCLGKAYAVWWEHQHLTQRLASSSHGITKRRF